MLADPSDDDEVPVSATEEVEEVVTGAQGGATEVAAEESSVRCISIDVLKTEVKIIFDDVEEFTLSDICDDEYLSGFDSMVVSEALKELAAMNPPWVIIDPAAPLAYSKPPIWPPV